ncbi:major facilitator superfamily domain-containing protein [Aspergillus parasiticus]|uniref:Major facilitator superfamily domain-containing protein n=1 Tax=Aspergillus parasiticus TaxID=5067 RepID=A0A5N6D2S4_ASPPA|nr:major facilitator superfamily domain-containing protein [Aspergillus parasiticus]
MHDGLVNRINNLAHYRQSTGPDLHLPTHDIDLNLIPVRDSQWDASTSREFSLPPVDEGKDAWLCLTGAFFLEMVVWGFAFSFGVLQDYYSSTEPFSLNNSGVSVIGSCCMGILYLSSPVSLFILQRWPRFCRTNSLVGLAITVIGILASSFATQVWQLIVTQGIIYPIGACMLYYPVLLFIDEWFVRKKGLAFGVCWAGSGVAGMVFPFIIRWMLSRFSFKITMWAWSVCIILLVCPLLPFVKPRIQVGDAQIPRPQRLSFKFLRSRPFIVFQLGSLLQSVGYFAPSLYLPTYSRIVLRKSSFGITAPLTCLNGGTVIGFVMIGHLVDRWHTANVILVATVCTVVGVFLIWGLSVSLPPLCVFAVLYGIFAGSASATWPGIVREVKNSDDTAPVGLVLGLLTAGRGVGSIVCGPISAALINVKWPWTGVSGAMGYGTSFGGLIVFTGATACFGALSFIAQKFGYLH